MVFAATWGLLVKATMVFAMAASLFVSVVLLLTKDRDHKLKQVLLVISLALLFKVLASATIDTVQQKGNFKQVARRNFDF